VLIKNCELFKRNIICHLMSSSIERHTMEELNITVNVWICKRNEHDVNI